MHLNKNHMANDWYLLIILCTYKMLQNKASFYHDYNK